MARLFDRKFSLTIGEKEFSNFASAEGAQRSLRVSFRVARTSATVSDSADISIYNLNQDSRTTQGDVARPGVILAAGYGDNIATLFQGKARLVNSKRVGTDWITRLECGDGENERQTSRIQETFLKGTSIKEVFTRLANGLGVSVASAIKTVKAGTPLFGDGSDELQGDATFSGQVSTAIDDLLKSIGWEATIQNEKLVVTPRGQPTNEVVVLSPESGMIGSPEVGLLGRIKVTSLLQPQIKPLMRVRINSALVTGDYRVEKCEYTGDTHDQSWYTNFEGTPL